MSADSDLLQRYVLEGSEDAFSELVHRNIDLVYSVALRVTRGQAELAEDVAQQVFVDLARKARLLPSDTILPAWLHRATRLESLAAARSEGRRKLREHLSAQHRETERSMDDPQWQELVPVLDEALDELIPNDRHALVLRFFRQQSFSEIGNSMGVAEDAARMRVSRALARLADALARRGVTSSATAIGVAMGQQALISAPVGLAVQVVSTSLAQLSTTGPLTLFVMKTKFIIAGVLVAVSIIPLWRIHRENHRLNAELVDLRLERMRAAEVSPAPLNSNQDPEEHRELLRLRGEVGALRRSLMAALAATNSPAPPPGAGRKPGDSFILKSSGHMIAADGTDLGPTEDQYFQATHLGRYIRTDMLRAAGDGSVTNVVETALWAALNGQFSNFEGVFHLDDESASMGEKERALRQRMDGLAVNLETRGGLEFRHMSFDTERKVWSVLVGLDPGPPGSLPGTHFNFQVREDAGRWQVVGYSAGNALPPRIP